MLSTSPLVVNVTIREVCTSGQPCTNPGDLSSYEIAADLNSWIGSASALKIASGELFDSLSSGSFNVIESIVYEKTSHNAVCLELLPVSDRLLHPAPR